MGYAQTETLMTDAAFNDRLHAVYESRSTDETIDQYDQWAETYDADLLHADYRLPTVGACMVARHVRANEAEILEAGVGTGQVGEWLAILRFHNLTGFDLSENMLERARDKNVYKRLHRLDMLRTLQFRDKAFDAAIAIGIFALGHVPPNALDELIRVTSPCYASRHWRRMRVGCGIGRKSHGHFAASYRSRGCLANSLLALRCVRADILAIHHHTISTPSRSCFVGGRLARRGSGSLLKRVLHYVHICDAADHGRRGGVCLQHCTPDRRLTGNAGLERTAAGQRVAGHIGDAAGYGHDNGRRIARRNDLRLPHGNRRDPGI